MQIAPIIPHALFFNSPIFNYYLGHQMAEVYKDRIFAPYVEGRNDMTIVDIGANIGITSYYFAHFGKVFAVEPSAEHFNLLTTMVKFNKLEDKIIPINKAIYIKPGQFEFYHNKNKTMFSLHGAVADKVGDFEKVQAITLDQLFEDNKLDHVDLLKVDCEGSEYEIFASEGFSKVAPLVDIVIGETHSWASRNPQQLIDALESNGFKVKPIPNDASLFVASKNEF